MSSARAVLTVGICALLMNGLGFASVANGAPPVQSGKFVSSFADQPFGRSLGNGTFTVYYLFPSVVSVGSNFTTQVSLQVNELTGLQVYVEHYQVKVQVSIPNGQGGTGTVEGSTPLYPGAIWGPKNVTIPITQQMTGPFTGELNASVSIALATTLRVDYPVLEDHPHAASQLVGNFVIGTSAGGGNTGGGNLSLSSGLSYLLYLVLAAGVTLIIVGVFLPRIFPENHR